MITPAVLLLLLLGSTSNPGCGCGGSHVCFDQYCFCHNPPTDQEGCVLHLDQPLPVDVVAAVDVDVGGVGIGIVVVA